MGDNDFSLVGHGPAGSSEPDADGRLLAAMRRAIELAGDPMLRPGANPRVGCVLLDAAGTVLAEGVHRGAGTAHAEADALQRLGDGAAPHTAVVTLEPCAHHGRTPPCADALVAAGVRRVVHALDDPNPVASGGADALRRNGIEVTGGLLRDEALAVDPYWFASVRLGRPHVTWKLATTLDGRAAAADGSSRWITSTAARRDVHRQRAAADAVVAGTGTVLADDPQLSVRGDDGEPVERAVQPLRVVVGRRVVPAGARVLDSSAPTLHLEEHDPATVLDDLWQRGVRRVLLEGGPRLAAAWWRAGAIDRVLAYMAPALLGAGTSAVADLGIATIDDAARLRVLDVALVGVDLRLDLVPDDVTPRAGARTPLTPTESEH